MSEAHVTELEINQRLINASPAECARVLTEHDADPWVPYAYLKYINRFLIRACDPEDPLKRLVITVPYRHGKSYFCSTFLPIWYLNRNPDKRVILASYSDDFAARWGRDVRDQIEANPSLLNIKVSKGSSAANQWGIEGHRGGMKTAGVGGGILGWGANLFIIDDPHGTEDWASLTERDNRWRWWNGPAHSRLEPNAAVVVIGTRWHEDDFIGRLLLNDERGVWTHIHFPAIAEEADELGRVPGDPLCPERYDLDALLGIKSAVSPQAWLSGYQQRPAPEGGGRFKEKDFRFWSYQDGAEQPTYLLTEDTATYTVPLSECGRFITIDTALTTKTYSDYTVAAVWDIAGWIDPSKLILHDVLRTRMEGADHLSWLKHLHEKYQPTWIGVEETSISLTLISQALRAGLPIRRLKPEKDKYGRSESAVVLLQNHRMFFPRNAPWYKEFSHELLSFPAGVHDDQVDAVSYGAREFAKGYGTKIRPKAPEPQTLEEKMWDSFRRSHRKTTVHPQLGRWPR